MCDITRLLAAVESGERVSVEQLIPLVYDELRRTAARLLSREKPGQTLQATALVHEAFLRLVGVKDPQSWDSRSHFFAACAEAMRRILIENARRKQRAKHGGDVRRVEIAPEIAISQELDGADLFDLNEAIDALESHDTRKATLVKLRLFAGLSLEDTAAAMRISPATAKREWLYSRAWLFGRLR